MRNLLLTPFVLSLAVTAMPACSDDDDFDGFDDADVAGADGEFLGEEHARQIDIEFATDTDAVVIAKSAAIIIAIDENAIAMAEFALATALEPIVLDYAQFEIDEHLDNLAVLDQLLFDFGIAPVGNIVSDQILAEGDAVLRNLEVAFDVDYEYVRSQIVLHAEAFIVADELALQSPFIEWTRFFEDTSIIYDDHRFEAELLLRAL